MRTYVFPIVVVALLVILSACSQESCQPSWQCADWDACHDGRQQRLCYDTNNCQDQKRDQRTCACEPDWQCSLWSACEDGTRTKTCIDASGCLSDNTFQTEACTVCTPSWECTSWSLCENGFQQRTCTDIEKCSNAQMPETLRTCELISCDNIQCDNDEFCVNGNCQRATCAQRGGLLCSAGTVCSNQTLSAADTSSCCTGACEPLSCGTGCPYGYKCDNDECVLRTCGEMNASTCNTAEHCTDGWITVSDTQRCCETCESRSSPPDISMRCKAITDANFTSELSYGQKITIYPHDKDNKAFGYIDSKGWQQEQSGTEYRISLAPSKDLFGDVPYPAGTLTILCDGIKREITMPEFRLVDYGFITTDDIVFEERLYIGSSGNVFFGR